LVALHACSLGKRNSSIKEKKTNEKIKKDNIDE
jgi:hypothetical protein